MVICRQGDLRVLWKDHAAQHFLWRTEDAQIGRERNLTTTLDARKNLSALCEPPITIRDATFIDDGDNITLEANPSFFLHVIYTPGHTTDSVTYYSSNDHVAFVGDTIFKGSIGNYQYPGGNLIDLQSSIINKIFTLPDETVLCSGHSAQTTVGIEKQRYR